ncbi:MAG: hypothetical protein NTZ32_02355 [Planctomycetales bacterium]|nr:hypothetical protein [Planctomycetales bacterium]
MNLHSWIARVLWSGAVALGIGFIAGMLALILRSVGDASGAMAVRGVMLVSVAVFTLSLVSLVVLLAVNELTRSNQPPQDT